MKRRPLIALILSLFYFVPALTLFIIWMICNTGTFVCPGKIYTLFPLSPWISWLEWPWVNSYALIRIFSGALWGKIFLATCIILNSSLIFGIASLTIWVIENFGKIIKNLIKVLSAFQKQYRRRPLKFPALLALGYLLPAIFSWITWQFCGGWNWLCGSSSLETLSRPWLQWFDWSPTDSFGLWRTLGARIFVLLILFLNAGLIFILAQMYRWLFKKFRHNPANAAGLLSAVTYAVIAIYLFIDALRSSGWFDDLGIAIWASPWSEFMHIYFHTDKIAFVIVLALNTIICYFIASLFTSLLQRMIRAFRNRLSK